MYNVVKDTLGNKLLEVSIPHYKKWKSTLIEGELIYYSDRRVDLIYAFHHSHNVHLDLTNTTGRV